MTTRHEKEAAPTLLDGPVGVLGGGSWGTAIAHLVADKGSPVLQWMRDERVARAINEERRNIRYLPDFPLASGIEATTDLGRLCGECTLIFAVIPSQAFRSVMRAMAPLLRARHMVVSATKGFDIETMERMSQIIRDETCVRLIGVLSGPNISKEIVQGQPAATVVASRFREVHRVVADALHSRKFRVYWNEDLIGTEIAGALKNVMAICSGIATGMGFGDNTRAMLITRGLAEISRFGRRYGADPATFAGLAGVGDLIVTCSSENSRNFTLGRRLAGGEGLEQAVASLGMVAEGVHTTRAVASHAAEVGIELPITEGVYRILFEGADPGDILRDLMGRRARYEIDHAFS